MVMFNPAPASPFGGSPAPTPPDNLSVALKPWGVEAITDAIIVHERVKITGRPTGDLVERAQRIPFIFVLNEYGQHPVVKSINSLDGVLVPMFPIQSQPTSGYSTSPIISIPQSLKTWGERNWMSVFGDATLEFNDKPDATGKTDLANTSDHPLYAGAAVENQSGNHNRLVVLGSAQFAFDGLVDMPDPNMEDRDLSVLRFPANGELFTNSVLWLAKQEQLMALSPATVQVQRLPQMRSGALGFIRIGLLIVVLPLASLAAGTLMYMRRRD